MAREHSRRELLSAWVDALRGAREAVAASRRIDPASALRPPGALAPDERFLEACTACAACIEVCPTSTLAPITVDGREGIPVVSPSRKPCYLCDTLPCIAACPEGALVDPGGPAAVRIGLARVNPRRCVTFRGQVCDRCFRACPYPHQAIMMIGGRPLVSSSACTGCGLCEYACPEHPKAIAVVPERELVAGLRIPKSEMLGG